MNKYRNKPTAGYASKKEANYAANFQALARFDHIFDYEEQKRIEIVPGKGKVRPVVYVADFYYKDEQGEHVVDVKGFKTPVYQLKKRLLYLLKGIEIEEL